MVARTNASVRPSGDNAGSPSPSAVASGDVNWRFSPVSVETAYKQNGPSAELRSGYASHFPSADHESPASGT